MNFRAVNLTQMTPSGLRFHPRPLSEWPTVEIDLEHVSARTCIASWRWDVASTDEVSNNMSECAWDALHMGFAYMLSDIISLSQKALAAERLIEFTRMYSSLHAVTSYKVDDDIRRTWLKNETFRILSSPTRLPYVYHKWQLRVPLIFSLVINQICTRRLGLNVINSDRLPLCDTPAGASMTLKDLALFEGVEQNQLPVNINLDRRRQTFASDVLLVYELNNAAASRFSLISSLRELKSNSIIVPALLSIWAMIDGLSISVRGCDWNPDLVVRWAHKMLREACKSTDGNVQVKLQERGNAVDLLLEGAIKATMRCEIVDHPAYLKSGFRDLLVRCKHDPAQAYEKPVLVKFLEKCVDFGRESLAQRTATEPQELTANTPQYDVMFDDTPAGPCKLSSPAEVLKRTHGE